MAAHLYSTLLWHVARKRALARDGSRCSVSRWLGGECSPGPLHVHHIHAVADGGDPYDLDNLGTSCASHHPMWEALRRQIVAVMLRGRQESPPPPRCRHRHVSAEARAMCERRLAREHAARRSIAA